MPKKRKDGTGTVRLRKDGRWEGRIVVAYDENNLPKTKSVLAKTKSACLEKLNVLKESLGGNQDSRLKSEMLFKDWLEYWYEYCVKSTIRPKTQKGYEDRIRLHISPAIGNIPLNELNQNTLQQFYVDLKKNGSKQLHGEHDGSLSDSTVRGCHTTCRSALEQAVKQELLRTNPAIGCKLPPKKSKEMQILTKEEMQRFLIQAKEEGYYELFMLEIATGLRRGELLALQWDDINFSTGELKICKQVGRVNGKLEISAPKTNASNRTIVLPKTLTQMLWAYQRNNTSKWIFPSPVKEDSPLDPTTCRRRLKLILEHAECKQVRFHDLRHGFSSAALASGMDVKTLSAMIGHVSAGTTLDIYTHITGNMQQNAANKINNALNNQAASVSPCASNAISDKADTPTAKEKSPVDKFEPYKGKIRKSGTGSVNQINDRLWEGRYSPKYPDGKKHPKNIYAHSEEECEVKLAALIIEMKAEIAELKKKAKEKATGVPV
ncbi:MAG: site-specific integrase [Faecalibacterium sp.]